MTKLLLTIEKEDDLELIIALAKRLGVPHHVNVDEEDLSILLGLSEALEEVKLIREGKKEKKTLKAFLDEC